MAKPKNRVKTVLKRSVRLIRNGARKLSNKRRAAIIPTAVGLGAALGFALDRFVLVLSIAVAVGLAVYMLSVE